MNLILNGKPHTAQAPATIQSVLESLALDAARVAVELNAEIVERAHFATRTVSEGDRLEVVAFVGGG